MKTQDVLSKSVIISVINTYKSKIEHHFRLERDIPTKVYRKVLSMVRFVKHTKCLKFLQLIV